MEEQFLYSFRVALDIGTTSDSQDYYAVHEDIQAAVDSFRFTDMSQHSIDLHDIRLLTGVVVLRTW